MWRRRRHKRDIDGAAGAATAITRRRRRRCGAAGAARTYARLNTRARTRTRAHRHTDTDTQPQTQTANWAYECMSMFVNTDSHVCGISLEKSSFLLPKCSVKGASSTNEVAAAGAEKLHPAPQAPGKN